MGMGLGGSGRVLYRYPTQPSQDPHLTIFLRLRPYPRPNEGISQVYDEVSQTGSRIGSRIDPESTHIDPPDDPPDRSRDASDDPHDPTSGTLWPE